ALRLKSIGWPNASAWPSQTYVVVPTPANVRSPYESAAEKFPPGTRSSTTPARLADDEAAPDVNFIVGLYFLKKGSFRICRTLSGRTPETLTGTLRRTRL